MAQIFEKTMCFVACSFALISVVGHSCCLVGFLMLFKIIKDCHLKMQIWIKTCFW